MRYDEMYHERQKAKSEAQRGKPARCAPTRPPACATSSLSLCLSVSLCLSLSVSVSLSLSLSVSLSWRAGRMIPACMCGATMQVSGTVAMQDEPCPGLVASCTPARKPSSFREYTHIFHDASSGTWCTQLYFMSSPSLLFSYFTTTLNLQLSSCTISRAGGVALTSAQWCLIPASLHTRSCTRVTDRAGVGMSHTMCRDTYPP